MSYNCDTWKTKELKDLRIPIAELVNDAHGSWKPEHVVLLNGDDKISLGEGIEIIGNRRSGYIEVSSIQCQGEGSGHFSHAILEPALKKSTGRMVATRVWEGGDSIDRLTVQDGQVTTEQIDL